MVNIVLGKETCPGLVMRLVLAAILRNDKKFQSIPYGNAKEMAALSFQCRQTEACLTQYEIRFRGPKGAASATWDVERADDMDALKSALDVCRNQSVEVWEGARKIAAISLSAEPHIML